MHECGESVPDFIAMLSEWVSECMSVARVSPTYSRAELWAGVCRGWP